MKLISGIYEFTPLSKPIHPHKCPVYIHAEETDTAYILSWNSSDNAKYYGGTYWAGDNCPIVKANFNPLRGSLPIVVDGIKGKSLNGLKYIEDIGGECLYRTVIPKKHCENIIDVTQSNVFWYHTIKARMWYGFILHEADTNN